MFSAFIRPMRQFLRPANASPVSTHVLVCPPAPEALGFRVWLLRTLREAAGARPEAADHHGSGRGAGHPSFTVLAATQAEFADALNGVPPWQAAALRERIRRANSMRELWHLRVDVFSLVALHLSQAAAEERLAWLNRRFPTRGPRSGFAELTNRDTA